MDELLLELNSKNNALLMGGVWVFIEYIWTKLAHKAIMSHFLLRWRKTLRDGEAGFKKYSGLLWCSAAVWIPGAQPILCEGDFAEGGCQPLFARIAMGLILGGALSGGHWGGKKLLMGFMGKTKTHKATCINCTKKIQLDNWGQPCPKCGKDPHNKENGNGE